MKGGGTRLTEEAIPARRADANDAGELALWDSERNRALQRADVRERVADILRGGVLLDRQNEEDRCLGDGTEYRLRAGRVHVTGGAYSLNPGEARRGAVRREVFLGVPAHRRIFGRGVARSPRVDLTVVGSRPEDACWPVTRPSYTSPASGSRARRR
jgi:hypothetical protein